jgi:hypothetical protein
MPIEEEEIQAFRQGIQSADSYPAWGESFNPCAPACYIPHFYYAGIQAKMNNDDDLIERIDAIDANLPRNR